MSELRLAGALTDAGGAAGEGGGGGTPTAAPYVVMALDDALTAERVLAAGNGTSLSDGGANGNATLSLSALTSPWDTGAQPFGNYGATLQVDQVRLGHASGPLLDGPASGDDLALTGDLDVSGHLALGASATLGASKVLWVYESTTALSFYGVQVNVVAQRTGSGGTYYGIFGGAEVGADAGVSKTAYGLYFAAYDSSVSNQFALVGCYVKWQKTGATGAHNLTDAVALEVGAGTLSGAGTITTAKGIKVGDQGAASAAVTTAIGLAIDDIAAGPTNRYLIEAGPATPYLRLVAGTPAANQTNLYLAEGVTPTLRRVQWKNYSNLVAGDRVMVLV